MMLIFGVHECVVLQSFRSRGCVHAGGTSACAAGRGGAGRGGAERSGAAGGSVVTPSYRAPPSSRAPPNRAAPPTKR